MTLLEAWKDSLQLCKPQAIKLMILATLNAMRHAVRALCVPWFIIPFVIAYVVGFFVPQVWVVWFAVALVCLFLANRPTVGLKDSRYFYTYFGRFLWGFLKLIALAFCIFIIPFLFALLIMFIANASESVTIVSKPLLIIARISVGAAIVVAMMAALTTSMQAFFLTLLFYLDNAGNIRTSLKKAVRMILYNMPIFLLYTLLYTLVDGVLWYFIGKYSLVRLVGLFFNSCLLTNIYTKRVHDQYSLYQ